MNDTSYSDGAGEFEQNELDLRDEAVREERKRMILARHERNGTSETFHQALGRIFRRNK